MAVPDRSSGQKIVDNIFGDTPFNVFTSDQGMALSDLHGIHEALDKQLALTERQTYAPPAPVVIEQRVPEYMPAPQVVIDTSALAEANFEVADKLEDVIQIERSLLRVTKGHTPLLQQGNILLEEGNSIATQAAIIAFKQRQVQMGQLSELLTASNDIRREVGYVTDTISDEAQTTRVLLERLFTDIGEKVETFTQEEIISRMSLLQALYRIQSTFMESHEQMMLSQQRQLIAAQQGVEASRMTEKMKESYHQWERAEVVRVQAATREDLERALAILGNAQELDDINPLPYLSAGTIHSSLEQPQVAGIAFEQANLLIQKNPHLSSYTLMCLADAMQQLGRNEHAERAMRCATKIDPGNLEVWFKYGKAAWKAGKRAEAIEVMRTLIKRNAAYFRAQIAVDPEIEAILPYLR